MKKKSSASFSCTPEMLKDIDARAESLGLSRSTYLTQLIRRDLDSAGAVLIQPSKESFTRAGEKPLSVADAGGHSTYTTAQRSAEDDPAQSARSAAAHSLNEDPQVPAEPPTKTRRALRDMQDREKKQ